VPNISKEFQMLPRMTRNGNHMMMEAKMAITLTNVQCVAVQAAFENKGLKPAWI
jgi:hypothetical protein